MIEVLEAWASYGFPLRGRYKVVRISKHFLERFCVPELFQGGSFPSERRLIQWVMTNLTDRAQWITTDGVQVFVSDGIPHDAEPLWCYYDFEIQIVCVLLRAESFPSVEISHGSQFPELVPVIDYT